MACNCGPDRPVRRVLIHTLIRVLDRMPPACRDVRMLPHLADIVDSAEAEIVGLLADRTVDTAAVSPAPALATATYRKARR